MNGRIFLGHFFQPPNLRKSNNIFLWTSPKFHGEFKATRLHPPSPPHHLSATFFPGEIWGSLEVQVDH